MPFHQHEPAQDKRKHTFQKASVARKLGLEQAAQAARLYAQRTRSLFPSSFSALLSRSSHSSQAWHLAGLAGRLNRRSFIAPSQLALPLKGSFDPQG